MSETECSGKIYRIENFDDLARKLNDGQIDRFISELKEILLLHKSEMAKLGDLGDKASLDAIMWRDDGRPSVDSINYISDGKIFATKYLTNEVL